MLVASIFFSLIAGFLIGMAVSPKAGLMSHYNGVPNYLFTVIYSDKTCTVLREVGLKKRNFLVSTDIFGGKPIRPQDKVRTIRTNKERKDAEIPVLGYPPMIKDEETETV